MAHPSISHRVWRAGRTISRVARFRDNDLRAELQRLRVRASGQLGPSNAGRKPKVVFDPGARSSLTARQRSIR